MSKIHKYLRKLIKSKFHNKISKKKSKEIYKDLKINKETNFINNILSTDTSDNTKYKKLKKYWNYKLSENDIEFINNTLTQQDKICFINNKFVTNQRALICYKKNFKEFFKYQISGKNFEKLSPIFRDFILYNTTYSPENFQIFDIKSQIYKPHEQRLISKNTKDLQYFDYNSIPEDFIIFMKNNKIPDLNKIQRIVSSVALNTNENFLICAPTGVGKTTIAIMTIFRILNQNPKICYIAPMKSLSNEIYKILSKIFKTLKIFECTSDTQISKIDILNFNILVGTPEKMEILMRNNCILNFDLIIFDEIHILNEIRGYVIESLVMRLNKTRMVGMSATIYNYEDVGNFLQCASDNIFYFNENYRPVPISYELVQSLNYKIDLLDLIKENKGPFLVFVHSRKDTVEIAEFLINYLDKKNFVACQDDECQICKIDTKFFDKFFSYGVGVHNSDLSKDVKSKIEHLYKSGILNILVSTSTLSYGINLPVETVIIMGTKFYNKNIGDFEDLNSMAIKQMIGRAGRTKKTTSIEIESNQGTDQPENSSYKCKGIVLSETLIDSFFYEQTIESQLLENIHNVILSQIDNLKSASEIFKWFTKSYFYIRLRKINPQYFDYSMSLIHTVIKNLTNCKMLNRNNKLTHLGRITTKYFVDYKDAYDLYKNIKNIMLDSSLLDLLNIFFKNCKLKDFTKINFPIPSRSEIAKIYQIYVSGKDKCDTLDDNLSRIFKCILDISLYKKLYVSRLVVEYYKSSIHKKFIYQKPVPLEFSIRADFFGKFLRLKIVPTQKYQKCLILIIHDDKLLVSDLLYKNNIKYYKIPKYKFYEINIISMETLNSSYKKTIKRVESNFQYKIFKFKKIYKCKFLEFHDQLNYFLNHFDSQSQIVVANEYIRKFFLLKCKETSLYSKNQTIKNLVDISGDINISEIENKDKIVLYSNNIYIEVEENDDLFISKNSIEYIEKSIKNNMNMTSLVKLIFSLPEMYKEITIEKYKKATGAELGQECVLFYKSLYDLEEYDFGRVKLCLNIFIEKCSEKGYLKTMLNILFLLQKINKSNEKFFKVEKNEDEVFILTRQESNFYIFNNEGKYKYLEKLNNKTKIEIFEGTNYVLSDICKGYEIVKK
ncbi:pre-mRNA-splicing helicase [Vairimorpha necatrix]|uniref:Pre-mRNA-splicing helicase n=1 Tax=Vairimorpha necatrix TaxID=6039 RepID=A0AAX4J9D3_9MICR